MTRFFYMLTSFAMLTALTLDYAEATKRADRPDEEGMEHAKATNVQLSPEDNTLVKRHSTQSSAANTYLQEELENERSSLFNKKRDLQYIMKIYDSISQGDILGIDQLEIAYDIATVLRHKERHYSEAEHIFRVIINFSSANSLKSSCYRGLAKIKYR